VGKELVVILQKKKSPTWEGSAHANRDKKAKNRFPMSGMPGQLDTIKGQLGTRRKPLNS